MSSQDTENFSCLAPFPKHTRTFVGFGLFDELLDVGLPVEQRILGMAVQVGKLHQSCTSFRLPIFNTSTTSTESWIL